MIYDRHALLWSWRILGQKNSMTFWVSVLQYTVCASRILKAYDMMWRYWIEGDDDDDDDVWTNRIKEWEITNDWMD
jgi:hypothetical protein